MSRVDDIYVAEHFDEYFGEGGSSSDDYHHDTEIIDRMCEDDVRADWEGTLEQLQHGDSLSELLNWGFSADDISELAKIHRDREDLQIKIEELLDDCNFHKENSDFQEGNYDKYIIGEGKVVINREGLTPKEIAQAYADAYGKDALEHYKEDSADYKKMTKDEQKTYGIINASVKSAEFNDRLAEGVDKVFADNKFKEWLFFSKQFHSYSFNNCLNIFVQCPNATMVAGANKWKELGRTIDAEHFGKGITISIPKFREFKDKDKLEKYLVEQLAEGWIFKAEAESYRETLKEEGKVGILSGFSYAKIYDVSMTSGKELPKNETRETLDLSLDNFDDIIQALTETSEENGVPITYASTDDGMLSNAYGYFSPRENKIVVRDVDYDKEPRSQADVVRTTAHEMAHSMLHGKEMLTAGVDSSDKAFSCSDKEIEAEGTALLVCEHIGFDSGANTYGYLASYLPEKAENRVAVLKKATDKILKCSAEINARFDEAYIEQSKEADKSMQTFGKSDVKSEQTKTVQKGANQMNREYEKYEPQTREVLGKLSDELAKISVYDDLIIKNYDGQGAGNHRVGNFVEALDEIGVDFDVVEVKPKEPRNPYSYMEITVQTNDDKAFQRYDYEANRNAIRHDKYMGDGKYENICNKKGYRTTRNQTVKEKRNGTYIR